jgi:hypothetical protein
MDVQTKSPKHPQCQKTLLLKRLINSVLQGLIVIDLAFSDLYYAIPKYESENQIIDHFK